MDTSDYIALGALIVACAVAGFTALQYLASRRAKLEFKMSINRSYLQDQGQVSEENPPSTRLLVRNLSNRPSAIIKVRVKNPVGSILMDINQKSPCGEMPIKLEPWDVKIITTTYPPGNHTEGIYFEIEDIDENSYEIHDYTNNTRLAVGDNVFQK
jgi:hypothetical protein